MGSTKAFRQPGATNSDGSKMLSYKHTTANTNTNNATSPKPFLSFLTIQERLQDISLLHWHQPIDEALDLHLHGHLTLIGKVLTSDSWTLWPKTYCRAMLQLVQLVSPTRANELLTAKMAAMGHRDRDIGTQPGVIWEVVSDVKQRLRQEESATGKKVAGARIEKTHGTSRGVNARGNGKGQRGGKSGKIRLSEVADLPAFPLHLLSKLECLTCVSMILATTLLKRPVHVALVQRLKVFSDNNS